MELNPAAVFCIAEGSARSRLAFFDAIDAAFLPMHGEDSLHETGSFRGYKTKSALTYSMSDSYKKNAARFGTAAGGRARLFRAAKKSFFQVSFFAARSPRPLMSAPGFIAIHYSWGRGLAGGSGGRPGGGGAKGCARPTDAKRCDLSAVVSERAFGRAAAGNGSCRRKGTPMRILNL